MKNNRFIITKKIARHGSQSIIIVPKLLQDRLKPGTIAEIKIAVIEGGDGS